MACDKRGEARRGGKKRGEATEEEREDVKDQPNEAEEERQDQDGDLKMQEFGENEETAPEQPVVGKEEEQDDEPWSDGKVAVKSERPN